MSKKIPTASSILPHVVALAALVGLGGCYVESDGPSGPPPRCGEAVWVHGHRDRYGDYHPGHYRCRERSVIVVGSR